MRTPVAGVGGGFPIGGSFSRTSINHASGAKSAWAGAVTGLVVVAAIPFAPPLAQLPTSVLGTLIVIGVVKLLDFAGLSRLLRSSPAQAVVGIGTLVATVLAAPRVERGVVVGIALALGAHLYREMPVTVRHSIEGKALTSYPQGVLWFAAVPRIERVPLTHVNSGDLGAGGGWTEAAPVPLVRVAPDTACPIPIIMCIERGFQADLSECALIFM